MYVVHEPGNLSFDRVGVQGKIFPLGELSDKLEVVRIDTATGHETTIRQHESTFAYYVLEGEGYFEIDGVREDCAAGDVVVIPPGHAFTYKGKLKLLLVDTPPLRHSQEEVLD